MYFKRFSDYELHTGDSIRVQSRDFAHVDEVLAMGKELSLRLSSASHFMGVRDRCNVFYSASRGFVRKLWVENNIDERVSFDFFDRKQPVTSLTGYGVSDLLSRTIVSTDTRDELRETRAYFQDLFVIQSLLRLESERSIPIYYYLDLLKYHKKNLEQEFDSRSEQLKN